MIANLLQIILGAIELFLGRSIFWLVVGIAGFLLGLFLSVDYIQTSLLIRILIGVLVGILFSVLAVVIQRPMAAIFAFFAFGYIVALMSLPFGIVQGSQLYWLIFLVAGIVGAILTFILFDWAIIIGTSLLGAGSVTAGLAPLLSFSPNGFAALIIFLILLALGIIVQARRMRGAVT